MMKKLYIIGCLCLSICMAQAQESGVTSSDGSAMTEVVQQTTPSSITKEAADSAYIRNDFAAAVAGYESILNNQGESADLYYNLGNSYYKLGQIAPAILNYERALLMNPGNSDIRFNLELARTKTVDKVVPQSKVFFWVWLDSLTNMQSEKAWAQWGISFFLLTLILLSLYIFGQRLVLKKLGFFAALTCFVLTICANVFASRQKEELLHRDYAIVLAPSVTVKSTPNESGTDLFIIHEGRKVQIKDNTMKEWKEIKLEDGHVGWVPASVIEVI